MNKETKRPPILKRKPAVPFYKRLGFVLYFCSLTLRLSNSIQIFLILKLRKTSNSLTYLSLRTFNINVFKLLNLIVNSLFRTLFFTIPNLIKSDLKRLAVFTREVRRDSDYQLNKTRGEFLRSLRIEAQINIPNAISQTGIKNLDLVEDGAIPISQSNYRKLIRHYNFTIKKRE